MAILSKYCFPYYTERKDIVKCLEVAMENREIERKWLVKEVPEDLGKYEKLEIE